MSVPVVALATAFGGGAAGAAAAATTIGSVLSGVASGFLAGKKEEAIEERQIAAEDRAAGRYRGLGAATSFWEQDSADAGRPAQDIATAAPVGQRSDMVGQKYAQRSLRAKPQGFTYNRGLRQVTQG